MSSSDLAFLRKLAEIKRSGHKISMDQLRSVDSRAGPRSHTPLPQAAGPHQAGPVHRGRGGGRGADGPQVPDGHSGRRGARAD